MSNLRRLSWFKMQNAGSGVATLDIFGDIGGYGVNFPMFAQQLERLGLGAGDTLKIRINSDGGDVYQGFAIFQALQLHPAKKEITVMGLAASMASVIFMAGDVRIMPANATLMIHNPVGQIVGESDEIISFGEGVGKMKDNIAQAYADASGGKLSVKKANALMDRQSWLGADEALSLGLATDIQAAVKIAAKFDLSRYPNAPKRIDASQGVTTMTKNSNTGRKREEFNFEGDDAATRNEVRAEVLAQHADVTALCRVAGKPELAALFNADDMTTSEVIAELDVIAKGGASDYFKPAVGANGKALKKASGRTTAASRAAAAAAGTGADRVELNNRSAVDTGNGESTAAEINPVKIWDKWNKVGATAH